MKNSRNNSLYDSNEKTISLSGKEMIDMGWNIGDLEPTDNFTLTIDTAPESREIKIHLTDVDGGDYLDWEFDYEETLRDLDDHNHLPCGIFQGDSVFYNDHEKETSQSIQHGEISEILGDTTSLELKAYSSIDALNREISGFSFSFSPKYL